MMTTFKFTAPQKRRRVYASKAPPFPVPLENQTSTQPPGHWAYYSAYFVDGCILVRHSGDMEQLYNLGFFGKGTLSRHRPYHANSHPVVRSRDPATGETRKLKITRKRQYLHHMAWGDVDDPHDPHTHATTEDLPLPKKIKAQKINCTTTNAEQFMDKNAEQSTDETIKESDCVPSVETREIQDCSYIQSHPKLDNDPWASMNTAGMSDSVADDPWDTTDNKDAMTFWGMETETVTPGETRTENTFECAPSNDGTDGSMTDCAVNKQDVEQSLSNVTTEPYTSQEDSSVPTEFTHSNVDVLVCGEEGTQALDSSVADKHVTSDNSAGRLAGFNTDPSTTTSAGTDPRSLEDDPDADVFVVDDTDDSDIDESEVLRPKWRPAAKRDPFKVTESLQLSMEEAFFLSYALGCLVVYGENKEAQTLSDLWCRFCAKDSQFLPKYAVYHNLRSKGWVPKSGLKYGSDFVVYKEGPAFYHSSYSVVVHHVAGRGLLPLHHGKCRGNSWTALAGLNRTTEQVSKEVMLCYVIEPEGLTTEEKKSPKCLSRFKIQEVIIRRWISKQERENAEYVLIP